MVGVIRAVALQVHVCLHFRAEVSHALPANIDPALDAGHFVAAAVLLNGRAAVLVGAHPPVGTVH